MKHGFAYFSSFLLIGVFAFLCACEKSESNTGDSVAKKSIVIGFLSSPDSLDPLAYRGARAALILEQFVSMPLVERGVDKRELIPVLATEIPTGLKNTVTWTLRKEARFGTGEKVTSTDVKSTIEHLLKLKSGGRQYDAVRGILEVTVVDETQFRLRYERLGYLDIENFGTTFMVLPKSFYSNHTLGDVLRSASGPFVLENTNSSQTNLRRKEDWWADTCPDLRGRFEFASLQLRYASDHGALLLLLKEGALDLAAISEQQSTALEGTKVKTRSFETASFSFVGWNCRSGITASAEARRILGRTIPITQVAKKNASLDPHFGLFRDSNSTSRNPIVSDDELKMIGLKDEDGDGQLEFDGKNTRLNVLIPIGDIPWAEKILNEWREVASQRGLIVDIERLAIPEMLTRLAEGRFDAFALIWRVRESEPSFRDLLHSSQISQHGRNFMGFKMPELDRQLEALESTQNAATRSDLRVQLALMLARSEPLTPLFRHIAHLGIWDTRIECRVGRFGISWPSLRIR